MMFFLAINHESVKNFKMSRVSISKIRTLKLYNENFMHPYAGKEMRRNLDNLKLKEVGIAEDLELFS